jgi:polysaccharide biosynthesis protein PslG
LRIVATLIAALLLAAGLLACGSGDEPPPEPEAGDPALGYNDVLRAEVEGNELLGEGGADFLRTPISWAVVEQTEGERDWSVYDDLYDELQEMDVAPLWVPTSAPCWASILPCRGVETSLAPRPEHVDEYGDFVAELAERYPGTIGIEVWNEPNLERYFRGTDSVEEYGRLFEAAASAVGERGSEVPVVIAGLSPITESGPGKIAWPEFLRELLAGEAARDADGLALHPYTTLVPDEAPPVTVRRIYEQTREITERVGAGGLPLWVTEIGITTAGPRGVGPERQADQLVATWETLVEAGAPVIGVHRLFDQVDPPYPAEGGYGVVEADRTTAKPALCALAAASGSPCDEE